MGAFGFVPEPDDKTPGPDWYQRWADYWEHYGMMSNNAMKALAAMAKEQVLHPDHCTIVFQQIENGYKLVMVYTRTMED